MQHMFSRFGSPWVLSTLTVITVAALTGCAEYGPEETGFPDSLVPTLEATPMPESTVLLAEFVAHMSPRDKTLTFERVQRANAVPGLNGQSVDELPIGNDDIEGSGPSNTVELVTNTVGEDGQCPAGFQTNSFCANVTLRHFYRRSLANVFVQITSITPATSYNAINSDAAEFGLDNTHGLWKYTSSASSVEGVFGQAPNNSGSKDWVFNDPDNAETSIAFRVVSSLKYSSYTFASSGSSFVDGCDGTVLSTASSVTKIIPFPFTLYGSTSTTVKYNTRGMLTFGSVNGSTVGTNVQLPNSKVPKPGIFVFWDKIQRGTSGGMCYNTRGSAPNRQVIITWKDFNFEDVADQTAHLTFSAILSEGTNNIDILYGTMSGTTSRVSGNSATVGVQNEAGTEATASFNEGNYGSGNGYTIIPVP